MFPVSCSKRTAVASLTALQSPTEPRTMTAPHEWMLRWWGRMDTVTLNVCWTCWTIARRDASQTVAVSASDGRSNINTNGCNSCTQQQVMWYQGPKRNSTFVCRYVEPPGECYYNTVLCCDYFSSLSVVSCTFSALCVYSSSGIILIPLGYLCAKFHFFCDLHCWASPWRKIAHSITQ